MLRAMTTTTPASQAPVVDFLGCRARVLNTGGGLGLVDMIEVPAGHMPPLHVHRNEDEGFYVLSGRVRLLPPGPEIELGPRDTAPATRTGASTSGPAASASSCPAARSSSAPATSPWRRATSRTPTAS